MVRSKGDVKGERKGTLHLVLGGDVARAAVGVLGRLEV